MKKLQATLLFIIYVLVAPAQVCGNYSVNSASVKPGETVVVCAEVAKGHNSKANAMAHKLHSDYNGLNLPRLDDAVAWIFCSRSTL